MRVVLRLMVRLGISLLAAVATLAAHSAPASAQPPEVSSSEGLEEIERARELAARSVEATIADNRVNAYELARSAYLDHFALTAASLRPSDPTLVLDIEFDFADLRDGIRRGETIGDVRSEERSVQAGLDDAERGLTEPGAFAPLAAFGSSFAIVFREGLIAVLAVALLLAALAAARAEEYARPVAWGAVGAVGAGVLAFAALTALIELAPADREFFEAVVAVASVGLVVATTALFLLRLARGRLAPAQGTRLAAAALTTSAFGFGWLGFGVVVRESLQAALLSQGLTLFSGGLLVWVAVGAVAAAGALFAIARAALVVGRRLPLRRLTIAAFAAVALVSVALAGNAVRALQALDVFGSTPVESGWVDLPIFAAELTGIHPTLQGIAVQALLGSFYLGGALWILAIKPARERRRALALAEDAA